MQKAIRFVGWLVAAFLAYQAGTWGYEVFKDYRAGGEEQRQVLDMDKMCWMEADTQQCYCRHRQTNERLDVPYRECVERVRGG